MSGGFTALAVVPVEPRRLTEADAVHVVVRIERIRQTRTSGGAVRPLVVRRLAVRVEEAEEKPDLPVRAHRDHRVRDAVDPLRAFAPDAPGNGYKDRVQFFRRDPRLPLAIAEGIGPRDRAARQRPEKGPEQRAGIGDRGGKGVAVEDREIGGSFGSHRFEPRGRSFGILRREARGVQDQEAENAFPAEFSHHGPPGTENPLPPDSFSDRRAPT